ncbi:MAG: CPXCG motif-containing cysteine-rich protein [Gammaproteobacteria bacterium]|nr:CPXCG motif-containing cysteine-rich protein [Gammaproteobacteria bacterium]MDH5650487.1 CPXCG motif-containing cysteine-rich protein [Gammaproteobacteria bacterium]
MLQETSVCCPWCGENFTLLVDSSAGNQQYIEDCQICCSPILCTISTDIDGAVINLDTRRDNE